MSNVPQFVGYVTRQHPVRNVRFISAKNDDCPQSPIFNQVHTTSNSFFLRSKTLKFVKFIALNKKT